MNMTEDVRQTIADTLYAAAEDWSLSGENKLAIDEALAWLDAQSDAPKKSWQPLASGEVIELDGDGLAEIGKWGLVTFRDVETGERMAISFPPRYRICILTEATE